MSIHFPHVVDRLFQYGDHIVDGEEPIIDPGCNFILIQLIHPLGYRQEPDVRPLQEIVVQIHQLQIDYIICINTTGRICPIGPVMGAATGLVEARYIF